MRNSGNIRILLIIILCFVPLIIAPWTNDYFYYPKIFSVYFITLVMIGIHINAKNRLKIEKVYQTKMLMLYWFMLIYSTIFSTNYINSIWGSLRREEGLITISTYVILFILSNIYFRWDEKYLKWILGSAIMVSLYGIFQYFGLDPLPRDEIRITWGNRSFSTMGNPNFLASYLILMLPLPLFSFLNHNKSLLLISSSIIYTCLLLTFTRSALLGFLVILFFVAYLIHENKLLWKNAIVLFSVFAILTILVNFHSNGRLYSRFISIGNDAKILVERDEDYEKAGANRIYIWTRTLELVKDRPMVGYGLENLQPVFVDKYGEEMIDMFETIFLVDRAHNEYLHLAVSSGIPSLIVYLIFIYLCLREGFKITKKDTRYLQYITAVSAYLVQAFFNISVVSVAYIFWIFLGVITNENVFGQDARTGC